MVVTELEKSLLLAFLILTGGSTRKCVQEKTIINKFPPRQRKNVRRYLNRLVRTGFIVKEEKGFKLTKVGLRRAKMLLVEGAKLI